MYKVTDICAFGELFSVGRKLENPPLFQPTNKIPPQPINQFKPVIDWMIDSPSNSPMHFVGQFEAPKYGQTSSSIREEFGKTAESTRVVDVDAAFHYLAPELYIYL